MIQKLATGYYRVKVAGSPPIITASKVEAEIMLKVLLRRNR